MANIIDELSRAYINTLTYVARGIANGNDIPDQDQNSIEHAYASAALQRAFAGGRAARILGDAKEFSSDTGQEFDSIKDQYNNEVGRRIANWARENNENSIDTIQRLVVDAYKNGQLLVERNGELFRSFRAQNNSFVLVPVNYVGLPPVGWVRPTNDPRSPEDNYLPPNFENVPDPRENLQRIIDCLRGHAANISNWLADIFGDSLRGRDPLVFDLNGGGAQLTSLRGSEVFFDLDNNGFAERTGWVRAGDGLLALDVNGNGRIDNGGELFGTATTDGFTILSQYDSNGDNQITSADAIWDRLLIWRDGIAGGAGGAGALGSGGISADGISTGAELSRLNDNGIVSINLNDRAPARNERFREGNAAAANDNFEWRMVG